MTIIHLSLDDYATGQYTELFGYYWAMTTGWAKDADIAIYDYDKNLIEKFTIYPGIEKLYPQTGFLVTLINVDGTGAQTTGHVDIIPPDFCKDVDCPDVCVGKDLYSQRCDPNTGECELDTLIESNSIQCGYIPPEEPTGNLIKVIVPVAIGIGLLSLLRK